MAAHGHDHAAHAHDAHDDFDPEPAKELSEGEPKSPAWLPILGLSLFLVGGIWFLASGTDDKNGAAGSASASASAAAAPAAAPAAPPRPAVSAANMPARPPIDPAQRRAAQERLDRMRAQQAASAAPEAK